jgi:anti-sigma-K factor RskA
MPARSSWHRSASRPRPTVADPRRRGSPRGLGSQPGWREVVLVAAAVVVVVLGAAVLTSLLPTVVQDVVFHTPVAIAVLIIGTGWLLWRISRREPSAPDR